MPSPKRARLDITRREDSAGASIDASERPPNNSLATNQADPVHVFANVASQSSVTEYPMQLPGLGLFNETLAPIKQDSQVAQQIAGALVPEQLPDLLENPRDDEPRHGIVTTEQPIEQYYDPVYRDQPPISIAPENTQLESVMAEETVSTHKNQMPLNAKLEEATLEELAHEELYTSIEGVILPNTELRPRSGTGSQAQGAQDLRDTQDKDGIERNKLGESAEETQGNSRGTDKDNDHEIIELGRTVGAIAEAKKTSEDAEFEMDSSPLVSSSSDISSDTSSEDGSDAEPYEMLDPEEQARRLMAEDGGSDDGRPGKEGKSFAGIPRTLNEAPDEVVPKPNVTITPEMNVEELGQVENLVENSVLIKAKTSGEYQVLESGSVLCLEDRSVIGVVAETLGRVQQPYYSVQFTNAAAMDEAGVVQHTRIFYVKELSTTVFTKPLKAFKGSDASNLWDEEVGDEELEFSDDEAEAEHKRQLKLQKRAKYDAKHGQDGFSRGPQNRPERPNAIDRGLPSLPERPPEAADVSLNYDDVNDADDLYTPLARPSNLHEMMTGKPPAHDHNADRNNDRKNDNRGGRGRARGGQGRGARGNDRGSRVGYRGGSKNEGRSKGIQHSPSTPHSSGHILPPNRSLPPRPPQIDGRAHQTGHATGFSQSQPSQPLPSHLPGPRSSYQHPYPQPQIHNNSYGFQHPGKNQNQQQWQAPQGYPLNNAMGHHLSQVGQTPPHMPPSPTNIPAGAHINPAFFQQQAWQQQLQQQPPPLADNGFDQQRVEDILRSLNGGNGLPS